MTTVAPPPDAPRPAPAPRRRGRYVVAVGGCVVAIVAIVGARRRALRQRRLLPHRVRGGRRPQATSATDRFRLAGAVVPGSVEETRRGRALRGHRRRRHRRRRPHRVDPPDLFKEGAPVVCEGHWRSTTRDAPFESDRIMIRHGSEYEPPKVDTSEQGRS